MKSRSWPVIAVLVVFISSIAAAALLVPGLLTGRPDAVRPWDVRSMVREALQDALRSDETRALLVSMMPETTLDRQALVRDVVDAITTSAEARDALKAALYTPEARQAFAAALKSPEAETAIREILSSPGVRKLVTDIVRDTIRRGY